MNENDIDIDPRLERIWGWAIGLILAAALVVGFVVMQGGADAEREHRDRLVEQFGG